MNEPEELPEEELDLTVEQKLKLEKTLEDIEPLSTSEYINLLGELDVTKEIP